MPKHIMLDLETMGVSPDAAIVAIGAVHFDFQEQKILDRFYRVVDLKSSVAAGGKIDPDTVIWWLSKPEEARQELYVGEHICSVTFAFNGWCKSVGQKDDLRVWGNGVANDNVWLRRAYERMDFTPPWDFRHDRCYRTVKAQHPDVIIDWQGVPHKAIDDAEWQARWLMAALGTAGAN